MNGKIFTINFNNLIYLFIVGNRPSVLFRDEQKMSNGGDAVIDMGSDGMYNSSMKQQLQVIDETVSLKILFVYRILENVFLGYIFGKSVRSDAKY